MIDWLIFIGSVIALISAVAGVIIWVDRSTDPCCHSYERVDTCNDKRMILVCRKCGKIKQLIK